MYFRPELSLPAESLMRHHLSEIVETAIRDTNAQYEDAEILQRLDVELLDAAEGAFHWPITLKKLDNQVS